MTLAWWYVHYLSGLPLCSASEPLFMHCSISYSVQALVLFMPIYIHSCVAFIYALHLFLRYIHSCACILFLFSCISHKAWSPPDLFFSSTCIKSQISWPECFATLCRERDIRGIHGSIFARDIPAFGGFQSLLAAILRLKDPGIPQILKNPKRICGQFEVLFPANPHK